MATTVIYQRTRENQIVKTYTFTTTNVMEGMTYDKEFFWLSSDNGTGELTQVNLATGVVKEVTGLSVSGSGLVDLCFDGEFFWGPYGKFALGIGQITREGNLLHNIGGITAIVLDGIANDGEFLWTTFYDAFGIGGSVLLQVDHTAGGGYQIVKQVNIAPLSATKGLIFDGEFLVVQPRADVLVTNDLIFMDRSGQIVKTATGEAKNGNEKNGMAFDGEFIYTMSSS